MEILSSKKQSANFSFAGQNESNQMQVISKEVKAFGTTKIYASGANATYGIGVSYVDLNGKEQKAAAKLSDALSNNVDGSNKLNAELSELCLYQSGKVLILGQINIFDKLEIDSAELLKGLK